MDPLSITVACVGLTATIGKLSKEIVQLVTTIRTSRKELQVLQSELSGLSFCLETLEAILSEQSCSYPPNLLGSLSKVLANCETVVQELEMLVKKMLASDSLARKAQWALTGQAEADKLRARLEVYKSTLDIALEMMTLAVTVSIKEDVTQIKGDTKTLPEMRDEMSQLLDEVSALRLQVQKLQPLSTERDYVLQTFLEASTDYATSIVDEQDWISEAKENKNAQFSGGMEAVREIKLQRQDETGSESGTTATLREQQSTKDLEGFVLATVPDAMKSSQEPKQTKELRVYNFGDPKIWDQWPPSLQETAQKTLAAANCSKRVIQPVELSKTEVSVLGYIRQCSPGFVSGYESHEADFLPGMKMGDLLPLEFVTTVRGYEFPTFGHHYQNLGIGSPYTVTALEFAATRSRPTLILALLQSGTSVNASYTSSGFLFGSALIAAIVTRQLDYLHEFLATVQLLVRAGIELDVEDTQGHTALFYTACNASRQGKGSADSQVWDLLLKHGVLPNANGQNCHKPLPCGLRSDNPWWVNKCLRDGVDIDARCEQCGTILTRAVALGWQETIDVVLANGADTSVKGGHAQNYQTARNIAQGFVAANKGWLTKTALEKKYEVIIKQLDRYQV